MSSLHLHCVLLRYICVLVFQLERLLSFHFLSFRLVSDHFRSFFCRFVFLSNFLDVSLFWRLMHATLAKFSERRNDGKLLQSPSEYFKTQFRSLWTSVGWLERSNFLTFTFRFFFNRTIFSKHIVQILNCSIFVWFQVFSCD